MPNRRAVFTSPIAMVAWARQPCLRCCIGVTIGVYP
ncbi:MAG: hypothetical protein EAY75_11065 [Bacteroidetes bacterium]|nr:MAG: hypothetical protein EAY75_11065 [Bacteroidota bacterium]